jgi:hypothetical protein
MFSFDKVKIISAKQFDSIETLFSKLLFINKSNGQLFLAKDLFYLKNSIVQQINIHQLSNLTNFRRLCNTATNRSFILYDQGSQFYGQY